MELHTHVSTPSHAGDPLLLLIVASTFLNEQSPPMKWSHDFLLWFGLLHYLSLYLVFCSASFMMNDGLLMYCNYWTKGVPIYI